MLKVGLTGGIASGKSTVSDLLASYGAVVLDADVVAREVVRAGTAGLAAVAAEFGGQVLQPDGTLDRPALGRLVFADRKALARLNAIVHPLVAARTAELFEAAEHSGARIVVHDVPLLVENRLAAAYAAVVVVVARAQTQLHRLVTERGMPEVDARARIAAQASQEDRLAAATHVVHNDGPLAELAPQVRAVWQHLQELAAAS